MSTAVSGHQSGAGPLSLMSCVRESSPPQDVANDYETEKNVSSKRKFWNPRKWFKRKASKATEDATTVTVISSTNAVGGSSEALESRETLRSRSTSELSITEDQTRRRSGTPMHPGLSVSHDSVFHSPQSGSDLELDAAQSSSSLSISHQPTQQDIRLQTELNERLRLRRTRGDTSEDDEGLPRSPCNSPTTTEGHLDKSKDPTKSHSTCSDGSLLSMGSSEMDEELSIGQHSRHSSKLSLHEKRVPDEGDAEWGLNQASSAAPLNHSAAHHKVAVRPKRTHGAPRRRRAPVLPTTPEVNEDTSIRSISPDNSGSNTRETVTELYGNGGGMIATDVKLKCSSLPPGLVGPGGLDGNKLSRSRSNAGGASRSQDPLEEEDCADSGKKSEGFFGRIFPRRSGKKKKAKEDKKEAVVQPKAEVNYEPFERNTITVDNNLAIRPNALRSGPASRQRVQPIDIPAPVASNEDIPASSPLHAELESHFKSKRISAQPPSPILSKSPNSSKGVWQESRQYAKFTKYSESSESKTKPRITGLSSLQQRVLSLNEDDMENSFKSLTNLPTDYEKPAKPLAKSHSFKTTNKSCYEQQNIMSPKNEPESLVFKSISLDSVQNVDEKVIVESVNEAKVTVTEVEERNDITITGPSHNKAIVNISSEEVKEHKTSVTKIILKPAEVVVSTHRKFSNDSIELEDEDSKKRFSNENIEIVKKEEITPVVTITPMVTSRYKKHSESMKRTLVVTEKPILKVKSNSFEKPSEPKPTVEDTAKSQENLSSEVIRRKSIIKPKQDEEPELMKVFARRSLKLKDVDTEALSQQVNQMVRDEAENAKSQRQDSDKENLSDSSPLEERKKLNDTAEVTFRKQSNNKITSSTVYQRTVSMHQTTAKSETKVLKQITVERPKTEAWFSNNNSNKKTAELKEQIDSSEIISSISEKSSDIISEYNVMPKNFNQCKAEWEKRAKEGIRKTVP